MFSVAPVSSKDGRIVAVLGLRMKPEDEFSRILGVAKMGETGESYAFDARGIMLTTSRFEPDLRAVGLLPKDSESSTPARHGVSGL